MPATMKTRRGAKPHCAAQPAQALAVRHRAREPGQLKRIGSSQSDTFNQALVNQALSALSTGPLDLEAWEEKRQAAVAALIGIAPRDELEDMLAGQLVAHKAAMECYRRALLVNQTSGGHREALNQADKLTRTYTLLLDALSRHRGKSGQQRVAASTSMSMPAQG